MMHPGLIWGALAFYGLGIALMIPAVVRGRAGLSARTVLAFAAGLILNGVALVEAALRLDRLPIVDLQTALAFLAFNVALAFFIAYRRYRNSWLAALMLPFAFIMTLAAALNPAQPALPSSLSGGWLLLHAATMILGYTGIFLTFAAAILYLLQEGQLKSKRPRAIYARLPALEVCDRLYDRSLIFGLICLSVGIVTGVVWASRDWQGAWELDPKIVASMITWLIYLLLSSTRFSGAWRGRRSAYVAIGGFAVMMLTFVGASFLSSQHGFFPAVSRLH